MQPFEWCMTSNEVVSESVQKTVEKLCIDHGKTNQGLKVLNVGFGLGIVRIALSQTAHCSDNDIDRQSLPKSEHTPCIACDCRASP